MFFFSIFVAFFFYALLEENCGVRRPTCFPSVCRARLSKYTCVCQYVRELASPKHVPRVCAGHGAGGEALGTASGSATDAGVAGQAAGGKDDTDLLCSSRMWADLTQASPREGIAKLRLLLESGEDLFAADASGRTCAHLATEHARGWELHFILAIERACRERTPEQLQRQVTLLRVRTLSGDTLLHVAASRGHVALVRYLLTAWAGQEVNGGNNRGRTPLHEAAAQGHDQIVKLLLKAGVAVAPLDLDGARPLDVAVEEETRRLLRLSLEQIGLMRDPRYGVVAYLRCQAEILKSQRHRPFI